MTQPVAETARRIQIRPAVPEDFAAVCAIYRHHVLNGTATFELEPPSVDEMKRRHAAVAEKSFPWLVAYAEASVVGYAYVTSFRPRPAYAWTVEDSIYLDPAWTGCGVGRVLLERLLHDAEAIGLRQVVAVIGDSANTPSIRLHRALGFSDAGVQRAVGLKFGRWLDTVTMQRCLGEGSRTVPATVPGAASTHH